MSLRPQVAGEIPGETELVARAAFSKGSLAIRVRDELGVLFQDGDFAGLFPARGKPAWSAVFVQTNGLGFLFHSLIQPRMSRSSSVTLRRSLRQVNSANQRSTRLSQNTEVGAVRSR
jgi:hypothetical protein